MDSLSPSCRQRKELLSEDLSVTGAPRRRLMAFGAAALLALRVIKLTLLPTVDLSSQQYKSLDEMPSHEVEARVVACESLFGMTTFKDGDECFYVVADVDRWRPTSRTCMKHRHLRRARSGAGRGVGRHGRIIGSLRDLGRARARFEGRCGGARRVSRR